MSVITNACPGKSAPLLLPSSSPSSPPVPSCLAPSALPSAASPRSTLPITVHTLPPSSSSLRRRPLSTAAAATGRSTSAHALCAAALPHAQTANGTLMAAVDRLDELTEPDYVYCTQTIARLQVTAAAASASPSKAAFSHNLSSICLPLPSQMMINPD